MKRNNLKILSCYAGENFDTVFINGISPTKQAKREISIITLSSAFHCCYMQKVYCGYLYRVRDDIGEEFDIFVQTEADGNNTGYDFYGDSRP